MICKKCSTDNVVGNTVCSNCGCLLMTQNTNKLNASKKKHHFLGGFGGLFAVFVICMIMFTFNIGTFSPKYEMPIDRSQHPVTYVKNNTLGIKPISKTSSILSDYLLANPSSGEQPKVFMSENGEGLYFLEGYDETTHTGSLFASYNGKTKIPVSSKAYSNIQVSKNGQYTLFAETSNLEKNAGTLYIYKKNHEKEKVANNVCLSQYQFSENDKSIVYIELSDSTEKGDLYFEKIGGEREKIDSDVVKITHVSKFSSAIYLKENSSGKYDLYYWQQNKASKKISENISENMVYTSSLSDNFFFCSDNTSPSSYNLYLNTKNSNTIVDTTVLTPLIWDSHYQNVIYTKNFSSNDFTSDTYLKQKGKDAVKLVSSADTNHTAVLSTYDFKTIAYIGDFNKESGLGNLYIRKFGLFADKEPELIAQNVSDFDFSKSGKILVYTASLNSDSNKSLYLYSGKKHTLIAENIQNNHYILTDDAKAVFYITNYNQSKDSGNLFYKNVLKPSDESVKIDSDVARMFYPRSYKQVVYTKNYSTETGESELYIWKGKKSQLIDKGILNILFE